MSFKDIVRHGSGKLDYRLQIAGIPYNFVSDARLVLGAASGAFTRINGLQMEGQSINYSINALMGELQADSLSFQVVDLDEQVTSLLCANPSYQARLIQDATDNSNLVVTTTGQMTTGSILYIGQETIYVAGVNNTNPDAPTFVAARGYADSEAASYYANNDNGERGAYTVTDRPILLEGRKVKLFAYGEDEDANGPGQVIWRGVMDSDLTLTDGGVWQFSCQPITKKLEQEIGGGLGTEFKIRGIHHPTGYGFGAYVIESVGATLWPAPTNPALSCSIYIEGFHASRQDFLDTLNTHLRFSASAVGMNPQCSFDWTRDGTLAMKYRAKAGSTTSMHVHSYSGIKKVSLIEGHRRPVIEGIADEESFSFFATPTYQVATSGDEVGPQAGSVLAGQDYLVKAKAPYPSRFTMYAPGPLSFDVPISIPATNPPGRLYFDAAVIPPTVTTIIGTKVEEGWGSNIVSSLSGSNPINSTLRYVDTNPVGYFQLKDEDTLFSLAAEFCKTGSLVDFLTNITLSSSRYASQGLFPNLTSDDLDLADMGATMSGVYQSSFTQQRGFVFWGESKKLSEIIAEECKILGVFPSITSEGKITLKPIRDITVTELGTYVVDTSNALTKPSFPQWTRSGEPIVNEASLKTDYDPKEDEWIGPTYNATYADSVAQFGSKKKLKLEPFSQNVQRPELSEIDNMLWKIVGRWGVIRPELRNVDVPMTAFTATLGGGVSVSLPQMPNPTTGLRGITGSAGMIKAMSFDLQKGRGSLTITLSDSSIAGYAPSLQGVSTTFSSNPTYEISVCGSLHAPRGLSDLDFFRVGDNVRVWNHGDWTPALNLSASVSAITGSTNRVLLTFPRNLTAAEIAALSSSIVSFAPYTGSAMTSYQKQFCFVGKGYADGGATGGSSVIPTRYFGV